MFSLSFLLSHLALFTQLSSSIIPYLLMASRSERIEMSEVEADPSTNRPSTPKNTALESPAAKRNLNMEKFERITQGVRATLSPPSSSKGGDLRRPKSINGEHLRLFVNDTSGWNQSPTQGVFPPRKTKLHEYNRIWRRNHTLSLGTASILYSSS